MVDARAKANLLRKRVAALSFGDGVMEEAGAVLEAAGMRLQGMAEELRKEWLNDMVAGHDAAEFRHASHDPGRHFLTWLAERARNRFHVSWRAVDSVAARLGPEIASRLAMVTWPQEIAWAQRMRLSENPVLATKAAMFLREAEGNPSRMFGRIADIYSEAAVKAGYSENAAHEVSPSDIRFGEGNLDFNPLFLRHAARSYGDVVASMPRDRIEKLAARAARDERSERQSLAAASAVAAARRFPMRRMLSTISVAAPLRVPPNGLYLMEEAFLARVEGGMAEAMSGGKPPQAAFVAALADRRMRAMLLSEGQRPDRDETEIMWEVANLDRNWLSSLPESFSKWSHRFHEAMEGWQSAVVHGSREAPYDLVSDFGFHLVETATA